MNTIKEASKSITKNVVATLKEQKPSYFKKLSNYFPSHEMKKCEHFEALLQDKPHIYHVDESNDHVLLYSTHQEFQAIDYVWVNSRTRGKGIGKKLIHKLKANQKPIFLEVEPIDEDQPDTASRLKFYKREGFHHAQTLSYVRSSPYTDDDEEVSLEVLYWTPDGKRLCDDEVLAYMREWYVEVHKHRDVELYNKNLEPSHEVLQIQGKKRDLLEQI